MSETEKSFGPYPDEHGRTPDDISKTTTSRELDDLEADMRFLAYQPVVIDAAVLEGVDVSMLTIFTTTRPDPTLQRIISVFETLTQSAKEHAVEATVDEAQLALGRHSESIDYWTRQRNIAWGVQQVAHARRHIDEYGVDPTEAKVATQLQVYTEPGFSPEERLTWLRIADRVIPEVPGLDPADPQTAIAIEEWS